MMIFGLNGSVLQSADDELPAPYGILKSHNTGTLLTICPHGL